MKKLITHVLLPILVLTTSGVASAMEVSVTSWDNYFQTRSSYDTWYSFDRFLKTTPRHFDGNDICFISNNTQNDLPAGQIQYAKLEVSLYRGDEIKWFHRNRVGDVIEVPMVGKWKARWNNVGEGTYFFYVKKKNNQFAEATIFDHQVKLTNDCDNFQ